MPLERRQHLWRLVRQAAPVYRMRSRIARRRAAEMLRAWAQHVDMLLCFYDDVPPTARNARKQRTNEGGRVC